jgi:PucR-like helix-turn-helix protein/citrate synthase
MADDFVPGLEGIIAFETEIAEPDKDGGALRYRGVDIEDLVGKVTFGNVWALLVDGKFGPGPVVVGPEAPDLYGATASARAALAGLRSAVGWPDAPRPVLAAELLPERALDGDAVAREYLVSEVYGPIQAAGAPLLDTLTTYLEQGSSLEATARLLYVHPNTVRYRLRQISEVTGWSPTRPREAFTLQLALILGRQSGRTEL